MGAVRLAELPADRAEGTGMTIAEFLHQVVQYIEQTELQLDGTKLRRDAPPEEQPALYAEALRRLYAEVRRV
jgi:hypothetical protein